MTAANFNSVGILSQSAHCPNKGLTTMSQKNTSHSVSNTLDTTSTAQNPGGMDSLGDNCSSMDKFLQSIERRAFHMANMATGSRDDALDIIQDAMYKLVEKYRGKPAEQWRPLFYRILNSKITDHYRRNALKNRFISLASWGMNIDSKGPDLVDGAVGRISENPDQLLVREWRIEQLSTAVKKLPRRQREAFMLRCWDGMSTTLTAETMGCTEGSVKTHYSRALHKLRESLEAYWHE